ncbi:hypothetical protein ACO1GT_14165, partial [Staphylococcus arlettae]
PIEIAGAPARPGRFVLEESKKVPGALEPLGSPRIEEPGLGSMSLISHPNRCSNLIGKGAAGSMTGSAAQREFLRGWRLRKHQE